MHWCGGGALVDTIIPFGFDKLQRRIVSPVLVSLPPTKCLLYIYPNIYWAVNNITINLAVAITTNTFLTLICLVFESSRHLHFVEQCVS